MREKSNEELLKLVDEDNIEAEFELARRIYYGKEIKQDYKVAYDILKMIKDKRFEELSIKSKNALEGMLADMYFYGRYFEVDKKKAYDEYRKIVEKYDDVISLKKLVEGLFRGNGIEKDVDEAVKYANKGLALGNNFFAYYIGKYEYDNKNYQEAKKYFEIALDEKYDDSYFYLGTMYYEGYGVEKDLEKANAYFLKIEKDMLKSSIYLSLGLEEKIEFDSLIIKLRVFKNLKENALNMKKSHPYRKYYLRINTLNTSAIEFIVNNCLIPHLQEYLKSNIFRQDFKNEDEVESYVDSILK